LCLREPAGVDTRAGRVTGSDERREDGSVGDQARALWVCDSVTGRLAGHLSGMRIAFAQRRPLPGPLALPRRGLTPRRPRQESGTDAGILSPAPSPRKGFTGEPQHRRGRPREVGLVSPRMWTRIWTHLPTQSGLTPPSAGQFGVASPLEPGTSGFVFRPLYQPRDRANCPEFAGVPARSADEVFTFGRVLVFWLGWAG
jgi:hypothetical protein